MKKFLFLALYGTILSQPLQAQQPWSLRQCTEHAVVHNISIHQKAIVERQRIQQLSTARNSRLPNATFSASEMLKPGYQRTALHGLPDTQQHQAESTEPRCCHTGFGEGAQRYPHAGG